jgi:hypothetical protein
LLRRLSESETVLNFTAKEQYLKPSTEIKPQILRVEHFI